MRIRKNGTVVNLTEGDLQRIVKRTLNEGEIEVKGKSTFTDKTKGKTKKEQWDSREKLSMSDFIKKQNVDDIEVIESGVYSIDGKTLAIFTKLDGAFEVS